MILLPILDRYLLKRFLINLLIGVVTWIIIFLIVDIIENISKFIDREASLQQVALYYLYYIPYIISLTLPVAMLLSALFTLSTLAQNNEVVAELSSGISLYRLLTPLFILALVISIGAGFFNEWIVPVANQRRMDLRRYEIYKEPRPDEKSRSNIFRQDSDRRKIVVKYFNGRTNEARSVSIQSFDGPNLVERIDARRMVWKEDHWLILEGKVRRFQNNEERVQAFADSAFFATNIKPENMLELQKLPEEMSFTELSEFIEELRLIGADPTKWIVERHLKISLPFANLIVVILGAPLASRKRRGGVGLNFAISLLVSFTYFIIIRVGQVLGHQGNLDPLLGAWLGNLIFIVLGLYTLLTVRK